MSYSTLERLSSRAPVQYLYRYLRTSCALELKSRRTGASDSSFFNAGLGATMAPSAVVFTLPNRAWKQDGIEVFLLRNISYYVLERRFPVSRFPTTDSEAATGRVAPALCHDGPVVGKLVCQGGRSVSLTQPGPVDGARVRSESVMTRCHHGMIIAMAQW